MLPSTEKENGSVMHIQIMNVTSSTVAGATATCLRSRVTTIPISVAHASAAARGRPAASHANRWMYTSQAAAGRYETGPLPSGDYEARFYGDGGYSRLIERLRFRVP